VPQLDQPPPRNLEAEKSLISSILIDNGLLPDVVEMLTADDFYSTGHRKIYEAVIALFETDQPVDLVTVTNQLKHDGTIDAAGGASYLAAIVDYTPMAQHAMSYAKMIRDTAILRALIHRGNEMIGKCLSCGGPVEELVDELENSVFQISDKRMRSTVVQVCELLEECFAIIDLRQRNRGIHSGVPTGFGMLDGLTGGFQKSDLIILAARPSMGKTAFALNIARNAAVESGVPVVIFSLEMSRQQLAMRLLSAEARVNSDKLRDGYLSPVELETLHLAGAVLEKAPLFIDDSPDTGILNLRAKARRLKKNEKIGLVVIDYIQLMKMPGRHERRDLEISEISRGLKALAKELDVPVVALSQLNRQLESRDDKRPRLSDLRESGALEQDADVVAFIHREEVFRKPEEKSAYRGRAEIIVAKQRNGPTDRIPLVFLHRFSAFANPALGE
jgi:replicative DNA helicase